MAALIGYVYRKYIEYEHRNTIISSKIILLTEEIMLSICIYKGAMQMQKMISFLTPTNIFSVLGYILLLFQIIHEALYFVSLPITDSFFVGKYFSWKEVERFADNIAKQIAEKGTQYGLIVGTGRGGGILSALMSYRLNLVPVLVFDREYKYKKYKDTEILVSECNELKIEFNQSYKDLLDKPILLITARSQSGVTLDKYIEVLRNSDFTGQIDKCPFILSDDSQDKHSSRYYVATYGENKRCRRFPWEKRQPDIYKRRNKVVYLGGKL